MEAVADVISRGFSGAHAFVQQFAGGGISVFIEQAGAYGFDPEFESLNKPGARAGSPPCASLRESATPGSLSDNIPQGPFLF